MTKEEKNNGISEVISELIEEIKVLTLKYGKAAGTQYEEGVMDHGARCIGVLKKRLDTYSVSTITD